MKREQPGENTIRLDRAKKERIQRQLLDWYASHRRDLPWRNVKDPYPVWISEVMLQQTQVQTVIPYYLKFLKLFPTLEHLAKANSQQLLRAWAGLGYYSRAHNLRRAAQKILREYGGKFPQCFEELVTLPGIGRYTAGALLSIVFGLPYPALDGNVIRVLTRLFKLRGDPRSSGLQTLLGKYAQQLIPRESPGDFNQALMELGATVCLPRQPRCPLCPCQTECRSKRAGLQESLPEKGKARVPEKSRQAVAVIVHHRRVLIVKRRGERLLKDFWEFPGGEFNDAHNLKVALVKRIHQEFGLRVRLLNSLAIIRHSVTNRRILLLAYQAKLESSHSGLSKGESARWIRLEALEKYPFGSASAKIVQVLKNTSSLTGHDV